MDEKNDSVGCRGIVKVGWIAECWDEMKNDITFITIQSCNINEELNKIMQSSENMIILVRKDKLMIIIERIVF